RPLRRRAAQSVGPDRVGPSLFARAGQLFGAARALRLSLFSSDEDSDISAASGCSEVLIIFCRWNGLGLVHARTLSRIDGSKFGLQPWADHSAKPRARSTCQAWAKCCSKRDLSRRTNV